MKWLAALLSLSLLGCEAGEFASWPTACHCQLDVSQGNPKAIIDCAPEPTRVRGLVIGVPDRPHVRGYFKAEMHVIEPGFSPGYIEGGSGLTEYGLPDAEGRRSLVLTVAFPAAEGCSLSIDDETCLPLAPTRLENAAFVCEVAGAP